MIISRRGLHFSLLYLSEEPPIGLGMTMLARLLLPDEPDNLKRGQRLQQALRGAIGALRPSGPPLPTPQWRPYLIYAGEYLEGRSAADVRRSLAICQSRYTHAKQIGCAAVLALTPRFLGVTPRDEHIHAAVDRFSAAFGMSRQPQIASATGDLLNALHTVAQRSVTDVVVLLMERLGELERRVHELEQIREREVGG